MSLCLLENLFGNYLEKGMFLEKRRVASEESADSPPTGANRYVMADITSFFTLLVGIYFPSVTGQQQKRRLEGEEEVLALRRPSLALKRLQTD